MTLLLTAIDIARVSSFSSVSSESESPQGNSKGARQQLQMQWVAL